MPRALLCSDTPALPSRYAPSADRYATPINFEEPVRRQVEPIMNMRAAEARAKSRLGVPISICSATAPTFDAASSGYPQTPPAGLRRPSPISGRRLNTWPRHGSVPTRARKNSTTAALQLASVLLMAGEGHPPRSRISSVTCVSPRRSRLHATGPACRPWRRQDLSRSAMPSRLPLGVVPARFRPCPRVWPGCAGWWPASTV